MNENNDSGSFENEEMGVTETGEISLVARMAGVFLDPRRTFISLDKKPDFVVPLIIVMVTATLFTLLAWPVIEAMQIEQMTERGLNSEQIEQFKSIGKISGLIAPALMVVIGAVIVSAILLFVGNILMGGSSSYKKVFSVYCYAGLISIISYAVKVALILSKGSMEVYTSPAAFFPASAKDTVLFKAAAVLDVFAIWQLIVIAVGMSVLFKTNFQKSVTVLGTMYVIYAAISIVLGAPTNMGG